MPRPAAKGRDRSILQHMSTLLETLPPAPADPIFAVAQAAKAAGPEAIDGTVGVFLDEDGKPTPFPSVRKAVTDIAAQLPQKNFAYPHLLGLPEYRSAVEALMFGSQHGLHISSMATTGGTGAVAINLRLLKLLDAATTLIAPVPTWANHRNLWTSAGMKALEVPYVRDGKASAAHILEALEQTPGPVSVLLHVSCHNPLGLDLEEGDWKAIVDALQKREAIPLLDFAYQGFKDEPDVDARVLQLFTDAGIPSLVCWSASKNHSIYGERDGLAAAVVPGAELKKKIEGHYQILTRGLHSAAATFGQSVVACVQQNHKNEWLQDLRNARTVMRKKREAMTQLLPDSFHASLRGHGMFAMLPLTKEQVMKLRTGHKVFLTDDARINIAGIPLRRMEELCQKIRSVL